MELLRQNPQMYTTQTSFLTAKLIYFDVTSMYTYILMELATQNILGLQGNSVLYRDMNNEFELLIENCLFKNVCSVCGSIHQFPDGLSIDNPLSVLPMSTCMPLKFRVRVSLWLSPFFNSKVKSVCSIFTYVHDSL